MGCLLVSDVSNNADQPDMPIHERRLIRVLFRSERVLLRSDFELLRSERLISLLCFGGEAESAKPAYSWPRHTLFITLSTLCRPKIHIPWHCHALFKWALCRPKQLSLKLDLALSVIAHLLNIHNHLIQHKSVPTLSACRIFMTISVNIP